MYVPFGLFLLHFFLEANTALFTPLHFLITSELDSDYSVLICCYRDVSWLGLSMRPQSDGCKSCIRAKVIHFAGTLVPIIGKMLDIKPDNRSIATHKKSLNNRQTVSSLQFPQLLRSRSQSARCVTTPSVQFGPSRSRTTRSTTTYWNIGAQTTRAHHASERTTPGWWWKAYE